MIEARHSFEDWVRDCGSKEVGIIVSGDIKKGFIIKYHGVKSNIRQEFDDFDLITEYEYCKVADPKRCGDDLPGIVEPQECLFTGKMVRFSYMPKPPVFEDLFG